LQNAKNGGVKKTCPAMALWTQECASGEKRAGKNEKSFGVHSFSEENA
jgi:hypothetical protein